MRQYLNWHPQWECVPVNAQCEITFIHQPLPTDSCNLRTEESNFLYLNTVYISKSVFWYYWEPLTRKWQCVSWGSPSYVQEIIRGGVLGALHGGREGKAIQLHCVVWNTQPDSSANTRVLAQPASYAASSLTVKWLENCMLRSPHVSQSGVESKYSVCCDHYIYFLSKCHLLYILSATLTPVALIPVSHYSSI